MLKSMNHQKITTMGNKLKWILVMVIVVLAVTNVMTYKLYRDEKSTNVSNYIKYKSDHNMDSLEINMWKRLYDNLKQDYIDEINK